MESSRAGNVWLTRGGCAFFGDLWNLYLMGISHSSCGIIILKRWRHTLMWFLTHVRYHGKDMAAIKLFENWYQVAICSPCLYRFFCSEICDALTDLVCEIQQPGSSTKFPAKPCCEFWDYNVPPSFFLDCLFLSYNSQCATLYSEYYSSC